MCSVAFIAPIATALIGNAFKPSTPSMPNAGALKNNAAEEERKKALKRAQTGAAGTRKVGGGLPLLHEVSNSPNATRY